MFQLAAKNLAGDDKAIAFNSTLYALKTRVESALLNDYTSFNQKFARSLQFNFKVGLDSVFKYDGFNGGINGGITYAVVNERDKYMADFQEPNSIYYSAISALK